MNRSSSRDDTLSGMFHLLLCIIFYNQSVQSCYVHHLRISSSHRSDCGLLLAKCSENERFAVILGVWKVLAALLHHLLNSASAVSSWFEFVAEACLFGVCSPVVSLLYHSALAPRPLQSLFTYR